jgi:flagellar export protein FliJ
MKKFKFNLQSVLDVRKMRENKALLALSHTQRALQAEIEKKQKLVSDFEAALLRREKLGEQAVPVASYQTETDFIEGQKRRIQWADQAIFRAQKNVEKAMRAVLQARRSTKVIEVLREKAELAFRKELSKKEDKAIDELNVMRARFREEWG